MGLASQDCLGRRGDAEVPDGLVDVVCRDDFDQRVLADGEFLLGLDAEPVFAGEDFDLGGMMSSSWVTLPSMPTLMAPTMRT